MTSMNRATTIALVGGATAITLLASYAVYFDYKRQTDKDFRRKLRKDNKKITKVVESEKSAQGAQVKKDLISAVIEISQEPTPQTPDESEKYFMENVSIGERLSALGPEAYVPAALSFYRALRIYPAPAELLQIYDKTVLPPVMSLVKELIAISNALSSRAGGAGPAGAGGRPEEGVDGDEEEQMMAALQAAMGGAAPPRG